MASRRKKLGTPSVSVAARVIAFTIASPLDMPFSSKEKIGLQCSRKFPRQFWSPGEDLGNNAVQIEDGDSPGTFEGYIAALFRPKRRADELAWRAAARRLGVRLIAAIHEPSKCDQIISYWQPGNPDASVQITLAFEGGHYELLEPKPGVKLPEKLSKMVADAEEGCGMAAPRGGAKSQVSSPARKSWIPSSADKTWIPRSTPARTKQAASKAGTRVAARLLLSAAFAKSQQGTAISRNYSTSGRFRSQPSSSSQSPSAVQGQQRPFHWVCDVCHQEISGTSVRDLLRGFVCLGLWFFSDFFNHARQVLMRGRKNGQLSLNLKSLPGKWGNAV